ncbi:MAG: hypothetical protein Q8M07_21175, partial [Prosthecobacter sp.]|nr:hypothetical protein [Prosthecobacter sp.]
MTKESRMTKHEDTGSSHGFATSSSFGFRHSFVILISSFVIISLLASGQIQESPETIKIGPLKPLQTLPSLSPQPTPSVPTPAAEMKPATPAPTPAQTAPPPLPTSNALIIKEPLAQAYLYVEPYQTRFEVLFDAATMLSWLSPDETPPASLTPAQQQQLSEQAATRAEGWCAMSSGDDALPTPQLYVSVIKGLPGNTLPIAEGEDVALNQAMVGFMWEFATPPAPDELQVTWKGWFKERTKLPLRVFFGTQIEVAEISSAVQT